MNIPGGEDCQDEGGGNVSTFYAKHRSLISLAVGTSLVTAYFTSKATFVQMFEMLPARWKPGGVNQALI